MRPRHDNNYLHFTKKERIGITAMLILTVTAILFFYFYPILFASKKIKHQDYTIDISNLEKKQADSFRRTGFTNKKNYNNYTSRKQSEVNETGELFFFDPNTISVADWERLGLRDKTIKTIQNYLSKGGKFREPNDIKKIWGLQPGLAERLVPYVVINNTQNNTLRKDTSFKKTIYTAKKLQPIDINNADSLQWASLPGIGAKLSQRIINYRNKLGGFHTAAQVAETFGLADSTFKKILPVLNVNGAVNKININTATLDELKVHPYIRYHLANALVQYRQQHKNYRNVSDVKNIMLINDSIYQKIAPYLAVE